MVSLYNKATPFSAFGTGYTCSYIGAPRKATLNIFISGWGHDSDIKRACVAIILVIVVLINIVVRTELTSLATTHFWSSENIIQHMIIVSYDYYCNWYKFCN